MRVATMEFEAVTGDGTISQRTKGRDPRQKEPRGKGPEGRELEGDDAIAEKSGIGPPFRNNVHFFFEVAERQGKPVPSVVRREVEAAEVDILEPVEKVETCEETNGPLAERAQPVVEHLNDATAGCEPPSGGLSDSSPVEEDSLQDD